MQIPDIAPARLLRIHYLNLSKFPTFLLHRVSSQVTESMTDRTVAEALERAFGWRGVFMVTSDARSAELRGIHLRASHRR
jgi:hypothetical protein